MRYIVECRTKNTDGEIMIKQFRGFSDGLPDKSTANKVFKREVSSGNWGAVYLEKLYQNGSLIDEKCWYKETVAE